MVVLVEGTGGSGVGGLGAEGLGAVGLEVAALGANLQAVGFGWECLEEVGLQVEDLTEEEEWGAANWVDLAGKWQKI